MSPGVEMVIIFYLTGKITFFFSVYIPNSKNGIIFYLIGKKYMFFSGGLPQPRIPFEQTMSCHILFLVKMKHPFSEYTVEALIP
jgi:hypothetical protein